jgi:hypothetical protein
LTPPAGPASFAVSRELLDTSAGIISHRCRETDGEQVCALLAATTSVAGRELITVARSLLTNEAESPMRRARATRPFGKECMPGTVCAGLPRRTMDVINV